MLIKEVFWCLWMDVGQPYLYCHQAVRQYRKSFIEHPPGTYLFQTHLRGGGGLINLAKTMVSVLLKK